MTYNPKQAQYTMKYAKNNLKRIPLDVQISDYETIKQAAEKAGLSVNGFIKQAVFDKIASETTEEIKPDPPEKS